MAVTIVPGRQPNWLVPAVSPLAELGAALHVLTAPDHHAGLGTWSARIRDLLPPSMAAELDGFGFLWDHFRAECMLPARPGRPDPTLRDELDDLLAVPVDRFVRVALGPLGSQPAHPWHGDPSGTEAELLAHARARNRRAEAVTRSLLAQPGAVRERLVEFLASCDRRFFAAEWDRMVPSLHRAVDDLRRVRADRGGVAVLTGLAHGIRWDGTVVEVDKATDAHLTPSAERPLWVVPSLLSHPHLYIRATPEWPALVQYGVVRRVPGRSLPPLEVTAAQLQALADPSRLELCAMIAREARATQELATLSGLSAPTVSRHVKALREAGLVTSTQRGHFKLHALDLDAVEALGPALVASFLR